MASMRIRAKGTPMSFANSTITDIVATTMRERSKEVFDNITKNNVILYRLSQKGRIRYTTGGSEIDEVLSFATNPNASWYQGNDKLSVGQADVISAATFSLKQLACPVVFTGLEKLQNAGEEAQLDLADARMDVAEGTMNNLLSQGLYGDGTTFGGKALVGLGAGVIDTPSSGVYGSIDPSVWTFWQNQVLNVGSNPTASNIQANMNTLFFSQVRGKDRPDLIVFDTNLFGVYMASLQTIQRFSDPKLAELGFTTVKFMNSDVVLDGGVGGYEASWVGHFLNTNYCFFRPHKDRNLVPISPDRRVSVDQDAEVQILAWAGAFTMSNRSLQGYFRGS